MSKNFLAQLEQASLFELFRLNSIIDKMLYDPSRLAQVRRQLRENQDISYFEPSLNQDISGTIINLGRSNAVVKNHHDGKRWKIPFYMINIGDVNSDIKTNHQKVDRLTLKVGVQVGFINHRDNNNELYGRVIKLNQKTASVKLNTGELWRVSYSHLFYVLNGEQNNLNMLE